MRMTDPSPANRMPRASAIGEPFGDAGEERLGRAARAAHMLCDALWETLHEQLDVRFEGSRATDADDAPTERAAELAERLADVAATVASPGRRSACSSPRPDCSTHRSRSVHGRGRAVAGPADRRTRRAGGAARAAIFTRRIAPIALDADKPACAALGCACGGAFAGARDSERAAAR